MSKFFERVLKNMSCIKSIMSESARSYNKSYYNNNKERILEMVSKPITCDVCNCQVQKQYWTKHIKNKKHLKKLVQGGQTIEDKNLEEIIKINAHMERLKNELAQLKQ